MFPDTQRTAHRQAGAGLPVALFVITVLALIVVGMGQLQQSSGQAVSLQIQSQRAFFAAESGAQVGVAQVLAGNACSAIQSPINFATPGLNGCEARVACQYATFQGDVDGDGSADSVYTLRSEGRCGTGPDQAIRTIQVRVR
ncbi:hypothetical protein [Marinobacter fonticola]|uniref:hypothetical protein n=1 Tax=Marinobacter fonticola TaxID=2603215 RepID=UPI0011E89AB2|nr:hypothetical protein [Marinobacter fonticola]